MIHGHIQFWMAEENPAFAAAVAVSYSLEHGKVADAAIGETAWRVMAAQLLARAPLPGLDYAPFLARAAAGMAAEHEARARRDHRYFARQAAALKRLAGIEEQEAQAKRENRHFAYPWAPVEFVWEAYFYLRKREGPGTPLPAKREVRLQAALIWAFYDAGLAEKLPGYLWENRGLTAREFRDIEARQKRRMRRAADGGVGALLRRGGVGQPCPAPRGRSPARRVRGGVCPL